MRSAAFLLKRPLMKIVLLIGILGFVFTACRRPTCKPFDLQHEAMRFHLFPDTQTNYLFRNQFGDTLRLARTRIDYTSKPFKANCGVLSNSCNCLTTLATAYSSTKENIDLYCNINYDAVGSMNTNILYGIDNILEPFEYQYGQIKHATSTREITLTTLDSITLKQQRYERVTEITIANPTQQRTAIRKLFVKPGIGLIAFLTSSDLWVRH